MMSSKLFPKRSVLSGPLTLSPRSIRKFKNSARLQNGAGYRRSNLVRISEPGRSESLPNPCRWEPYRYPKRWLTPPSRTSENAKSVITSFPECVLVAVPPPHRCPRTRPRQNHRHTSRDLQTTALTRTLPNFSPLSHPVPRRSRLHHSRPYDSKPTRWCQRTLLTDGEAVECSWEDLQRSVG